MRDRERRLHTVATRMTGRQRVAALLAAGPDRTAGHDDVGRGLTPAGWAELRRDAERVDQLNATTRDCLVRVESAIADMDLAARWLATVRLTAEMADRLDDALDFWPPRRGPDGAADRDLDGEVRTIAGVLRTMAVTVDAGGNGDPPMSPMDALLRDGIRKAHHLLRGLAIEVAVFAADLAADPLDAELHTLADRRRAELAALIDLVTLDPPIVLTEPSDEYVAAIAARCRPEEGADDAPW